MNRRTLLGLVVLAGLSVLVWITVRANRPASPPNTLVKDGPAKAGPAPSTEEPPNPKAPADPPAAARPVTNVVAENAGQPNETVKVNADQVLGTVNGVALTLKDLVPLAGDKAGTDQVMSAEHFEFLLKRAVDRELTYQVARSQGVELTDALKERLAEHKARSTSTEEGTFDTLQHGVENTEFQQRDLAAMALQYALAEKAGVPSPHVTTEAVAAYYQKHNAEYRALPTEPSEYDAAWAVIDQDIRAKLAPEMQTRHEAALNKYLETLRATAQITSAITEE